MPVPYGKSLESTRSTVFLIRAYEATADYKCAKCGDIFNISDDSDRMHLHNRGHVCLSELSDKKSVVLAKKLRKLGIAVPDSVHDEHPFQKSEIVSDIKKVDGVSYLSVSIKLP